MRRMLPLLVLAHGGAAIVNRLLVPYGINFQPQPGFAVKGLAGLFVESLLAILLSRDAVRWGHRFFEFLAENVNKCGHDSRERALRTIDADELAFQCGLENAPRPRRQTLHG